MNDYSINDPRLLALEAQLAATIPPTPSARQQELLYECAFTAGQVAARSTLRRWQASVVALVVALVAMCVPLARDHVLLAIPGDARPAVPQAPIGQAPPGPEAASIAQHPPVTLDAWQLQPSATAAFDRELAQFKQADRHIRSLALGALTHTVSEQ